MASSVPAAVDYLVAAIGTLELPEGTLVSDGWPTARAESGIAVGITPDDDTVDLTVSYDGLNAATDEEQVELWLFLWARRVGDGMASRARRDVVAMADQVRELIRSDRRLGGAIVPGTPARVARWSLEQTSTPQQAGEGRTASVSMVLTWSHRG